MSQTQAATDSCPVPDIGKSYPLELGSTFRKSHETYHTLLYQFKPATINENKPGILQYTGNDQSKGTIVAEFESTKNPDEIILLTGQYEKAKETECILIFDGETFRLEHIDGKGLGLRKPPRDLKKSANAPTPLLLKRRGSFKEQPLPPKRRRTSKDHGNHTKSTTRKKSSATAVPPLVDVNDSKDEELLSTSYESLVNSIEGGESKQQSPQVTIVEEIVAEEDVEGDEDLFSGDDEAGEGEYSDHSVGSQSAHSNSSEPPPPAKKVPDVLSAAPQVAGIHSPLSAPSESDSESESESESESGSGSESESESGTGSEYE